MVGLDDVDVLRSLISLNTDRAQREKTEPALWLRPAYQSVAVGLVEAESDAMEFLHPTARAEKPLFPQAPIDQAAAVTAVLLAASTPMQIGRAGLAVQARKAS